MSFDNAIKSVNKIVTKVMGKNVVYTYLSGGTSDIRGVFDNAFVEVQGVSSLKPILKIRLEDLTQEPAEGDLVNVNSTDYLVLDSQQDSFGWAVLILEKN